LIEMAKEFIGELQALFFDTFIGWLRNTVIVRAVEKLVSMFNPVGAIVQAVITIYNMVQFFIERAKQIAALVNAVFDSIAEIAGGNLKKAVAAVEDSLVKALPVAIGFLANLVGIGGIAAKIKEIIQKIRKPIDRAVGKVVGFIADKAKLLIGKISGTDKPKEEAPKNEAEHDEQVNAGLAALDSEQKKEDQDHNGALTTEEAEEAAQKVKSLYPVFKSIAPFEKGDKWVFRYVASPAKEYVGLKVEGSEKSKEKPEKDKQEQKIIKETGKTGVREVQAAKSLLPGEGKVGTYRDLVKAGSRGDNLTPHHIPSAEYMEKNYGISKNDGVSLNMEHPSPGVGGRHRMTRSYGNSSDLTESPRDALARDIMDVQRIYENDGLYTPGIRRALKEVIEMNERLFPKIFKKPWEE